MLAQVEESGDNRLYSVLIARDGEIVFERYFNGRDASSPHDIRSATKSITALLVGIAIERSVIRDVGLPVSEIFAQRYPGIEVDNGMTVHHLLSMSSGKECDDADAWSPGNENRMYRRYDWTRFFLALDQTDEPGERGSYCTGGVVALGRVIEELAGEPLDDWADDVLFSPLGIRNYRWEYYQDGEGVDSGGHLRITPRGLLTIGLMLLNGGSWHGQQLISEAWIREMWTTHSEVSGRSYGYLWWTQSVDYGSGPLRVVAARGNGGQSLFLVPELDLAAVVTTGYYNHELAGIPEQLFYYAIVPDVLNSVSD